MEILRNLDQLYNKITSTFGFDDYVKQIDFVFKIADEASLLPLKDKLENTEISMDKYKELYSLVFQLNQYTNIICNLAHLFLLAKKYDELYVLINKIFVAHIGVKTYHSNSATSFTQRNFDRLVEIVKTANISVAAFLPFILEIYQTQKDKAYLEWKEPALEYLQNIFHSNEKSVMDFALSNSEYKYQTLSAILEFNTAKGIEYLLKDFFDENNCDKDQNTFLMKNYKRDILIYLESDRPNAFMKNHTDRIKVLLEMDSDAEVKNRIHNIYSSTKNQEVKSLISSETGLSDALAIKNEKQFLYAVRNKIKEPQERSLGLPFDKCKLTFASGSRASNLIYTFLINLFKEEKQLNKLYSLKTLESLFVKETLQDFVEKLFLKLYQKEDILQAKWCIRMFALFSSNSSIDNTFSIIYKLLSQNRFKEAKYVINCFIFAKRVEIIDLIKTAIEEEQQFIKNNLDEFIDNISLSLGMHKEDIRDLLVPSTYSETELNHQKERLYVAFISGKYYPLRLFKQLFIENKIYNKLAQNLVFGEYRFGRLYNAFVFEENNIKFIVGKSIVENDPDKDADISIGIIHSLDIDFKFDKAVHYFANPTFEQFKPPKFALSEYSPSTKSINRFVGMVFNSAPFMDFIQKNGFSANKAFDQEDFGSVIHLFPALDILCEVDFQKNMSTNTSFNSLGNICFYKISETMRSKDKYITQKSNALSVSTLPYRYFDYILSIVLEASKL